MAKHRYIDPEIRRSESVAKLSFRQRDLWYGLILTVDDQGRALGNPGLVRADVWALDDIPLSEVESDLAELAKNGFIIQYEIEEKKYIQIVNWKKYQKSAEWLGLSDYPPPDGWEDRYHYHGKGNEIITSTNWKGSELPTPLPTRSPWGRSPSDVNDDVNVNDDINIPPAENLPGKSDKPKPIKDLMGGMLNPAYFKKSDPVMDFPEDCQLIIREFIRLWKVEPPPKSSNQYGYWIQGAHELKDACREIGLQVLKQAHEDHNSNPFTVSSPNSIVKLAYAAAGKLRQSVSVKVDKVCPDCLGTGFVLQKRSKPDKDGRYLSDKVKCQRCGKAE